MAWRAMDSLLVLRDQVNVIAPNRSTASDGLVGDANHETTSGHFPHKVPGVGDEIVTAWDCTNDPDHNCNSRALAETIRQHRDKRIRYVISNRQMFSSYATSSYAAWTWRPYSATPDPHVNHAHIQVLDAVVSDTNTPWNLEGFDDAMTDAQAYIQHVMNYRIDAIIKNKLSYTIPAFTGPNGGKWPAITETNLLATKLQEIEDHQGSGDGMTFPASSTFTMNGTSVVTWNPSQP
jgi:hypothetical protein